MLLLARMHMIERVVSQIISLVSKPDKLIPVHTQANEMSLLVSIVYYIISRRNEEKRNTLHTLMKI